MIDTLKTQIRIVARVREEAQRLADEKTQAFRMWEDEHRSLLDTLNYAIARKNTHEDYLRELTIQVYTETGNKKPCKGVAIREVTKLDYEPSLALEWAKKTGLALKLDATTFEKIAKADKPDFVTMRIEPQATISQELKVEEEVKPL